MPRPRRVRRPLFGRRRRYRRKAKLISTWPRSKLIKASIVSTGVYTANSGALGALAIKINSLNDPFGASAAVLPLGIDQWNNMYKKYTVVGAKITVVGHPVTITGAMLTGLHLTDTATALTDQDHYKELPNTVSRMVSPDIDIFKMSMKYSPKKFWRIKDLKDNDELRASLTGTGTIGAPAPADPTNIAYIHFWLQDANKTDNLSAEVSVRVDYILLLTDPVSPARSAL